MTAPVGPSGAATVRSPCPAPRKATATSTAAHAAAMRWAGVALFIVARYFSALRWPDRGRRSPSAVGAPARGSRAPCEYRSPVDPVVLRRALVIIAVTAMAAATILGASATIREPGRDSPGHAQAFTNEGPDPVESPALRSRAPHLKQRSDADKADDSRAFVAATGVLAWTTSTTGDLSGVAHDALPLGPNRLARLSGLTSRAPPPPPRG